MTLEDRRREILSQPSAMKEVYSPADHYVNGHVILRRPDGWHLIYGSEPGGRELDPRVRDRLKTTPGPGGT